MPNAVRVDVYPARPSKALGDGTRPGLECGHVVDIDGERRLLASDSYILVNVPIQEDVPLGPISWSGVRAIERNRRAEIDASAVHIDRGDGGRELHDRPQGQAGATNMARTLTDLEARHHIESGDEAAVVSLNPRLLLALAKALGVQRGYAVTLRIPREPLRPIVVESAFGGRGLIQPMKLAEN